MTTENGNEKGVSPQRPTGGARRWYGAARGLAIACPLALLLLPVALSVSAYISIFVAVCAALLGLAVPGRPHVGKSAWRTVRESLVRIFAALHIIITGALLYFATGLFGFLIDMNFRSAIKDADRIVIRDGGGLCHSKPDNEPEIFEITNKAEIAAFNDMFKFSGQTMPCMCCGYPGIDWWRDGKRVVVSAVHHGQALRVTGFWGDLQLTFGSRRLVQEWLKENCGLTGSSSIPRYKYCRYRRYAVERAAQDFATANDGKKPTMDDLRDEFKKNGKEFPACPAGGEYSLTYGEDGTPEVKCTAPRHD